LQKVTSTLGFLEVAAFIPIEANKFLTFSFSFEGTVYVFCVVCELIIKDYAFFNMSIVHRLEKRLIFV